MLKEKIEQKINTFIEGQDLFLVDVKITPQQKIMVFLDGKSQNITIDQCAKISRMLEAYLEEEQLVGEKYTLEVSSPGMDQPFKVMEQYFKAVNRSVEVLKKDGVKYEGVLKNVDETNIQLEITKIEKGKILDTQQVEIPMSEIKTTKKLITFK
jgi:ribosome maturation factor RimP